MLKTYNELKQLKEISEEEFILIDRLQKIETVINTYGEDNFYMAFSGGKDSTVLSALVDLAVPGNNIPRVYSDTGIELNMVRDYVYDKAKKDERINIIKPHVPIKPMLEKDGYPFKSKNHARIVDRYNRIGMADSVKSYLGNGSWGIMQQCPSSLRYQFTEEFKSRLKVSDMCCLNMKEQPLMSWSKENNKPYAIIGVMRSEGGRRASAKCMKLTRGKLEAFQPMSILSKEWEEWFIKEYKIDICPIYLPPYNFKRTGCKGCPFAIGKNLRNELDTLEKFFPNERKQCELIWGPVYDEYRRLNYRLKADKKNKKKKAEVIYGDFRQMTIFDYIPEKQLIS